MSNYNDKSTADRNTFLGSLAAEGALSSDRAPISLGSSSQGRASGEVVIPTYTLVPSPSCGLPSTSTLRGDTFAVDVLFEGSGGDRLWAQVRQRVEEAQRVFSSAIDEEFGPRWETMVTLYPGSTHVNVVLYSDDDGDDEDDEDDEGSSDGNGAGESSGQSDSNEKPVRGSGSKPDRQSVFERVLFAVHRALSKFVTFAKDLWPHAKAVGSYIAKATRKVFKAKDALDSLAEVLGFHDARHAAKSVVAWLLGLWGFGPGFA